jgi:iron(III) transport system permease protein
MNWASRLAGLLLLAPLAGFALEAAAGEGPFTIPGRAWLLTLAIGGTAAAVSLALGIPVGLVLARSRSRWPFILTLFPLLVPPALGASAWIGARLPAPGPFFCGLILGGIFWPVVALLLAASLRSLPRAALEAAELQLSPGRTLAAVVWPHARPAIAAGALLAFLLAASDFAVPSTFAVPAVSYVIFERLNAFRFPAAAAAALPLAALAVALALAARRIPALPSGETRPPRGNVPAFAWPLALAAWALTAILPIAICAATAGGPARVARALALHADSIAWSFGIAGATALLLVAWSALSPGRSRLEPLWLAALVLPGAAGALGAAALAGRLDLLALLGPCGALLVLALAGRFAYAAWLPLRDAVPRPQLEAAELGGLSRVRTGVKIVWPAVLPRALAAGAVVLVLSLGEIGPALLLSPPGRQTVVQHVFNQIHFGYDESVAALTLLTFGAAALAAWSVPNGWRVDRAQVGR